MRGSISRKMNRRDFLKMAGAGVTVPAATRWVVAQGEHPDLVEKLGVEWAQWAKRCNIGRKTGGERR